MNRLRAAAVPLVTVTAPAGYGKTTLAAQWAERDPRPFAWISVDETDDDAAVLLGRLAAALEGIRPADRTAPASRRSKDWSTELSRLAARLGSTGDVVLVVDNAHLLRSRNATKTISTLADHVPPGSALALVGRLSPGVPIARLRAGGKLLELRAADLALSPRESDALLRAPDAALTDDEAAELLERCEGWAAGIRLGALAARNRAGEDPAHAIPGGDDRFLAEYFRSEFLSPLSPELLTFLRRTSVLEQLTAPVCDAVLAEQGSARVLASLERNAPPGRSHSTGTARRTAVTPSFGICSGASWLRASPSSSSSSIAARRTGSRSTATPSRRSGTRREPATPIGWR